MTKPYTEKQRRQDYAVVFGDEAGQRVLRDLLKTAGFTKSSFESDAFKTAWKEGRRSIALYIRNVLRLDDDGTEPTEQETNDDDRNDDN